VHQDAIALMISYLEQNPAVGIAGPRTFDAQGHLALTAYGRFTPFAILWQYLGIDWLFPNQVFGKFRRQISMAQQPFDTVWVQGSCMMIRREVYVQIGGLDEALFLFAEEPDFCERAIAAGWRIVHIPAAQIEHHESTTISNYPLVKMRHYHRSPLHYFRKRQKPVSVLTLKLGFTLELAIKFLIRLVQLTWLADTRERARLAAYPTVLKEIWQF
jgi:GT2 family glycosyltransferase